MTNQENFSDVLTTEDEVQIIAMGVEQGCYRVIKRLVFLVFLLILVVFAFFALGMCFYIVGG